MRERLRVIDSHTGGEPTRLVVDGGPDFQRLLTEGYVGPAEDAAERLRHVVRVLERDHEDLRRAIICEPRCSEHWVGAWLLPPVDPAHLCGVIFFNNVGYLGMCGHGTLGLMASLAYLGRVNAGRYAIETPVGVVQAEVLDAHHTTIGNVPSFLYRSDVAVPLGDRAPLVGDLAWGGNWFFLAQAPPDVGPLNLANLPGLLRLTLELQSSMEAQGITGPQGERIDHVELFGAGEPGADSRNFVLCPGGAYDRSPCGTGTSAKVACLAVDGKLAAGQPWVQESVTGSRFTASYQPMSPADTAPVGCPPGGLAVRPSITGAAYVCGETDLIFDPQDPFRAGIPA
jgi:4-hydroxyproline epimerase